MQDCDRLLQRRLDHRLPKLGFTRNFTAKQLSAWQVPHPNRQARGVGQSAIIGKQVGAEVFGERTSRPGRKAARSDTRSRGHGPTVVVVVAATAARWKSSSREPHR